MQKQLEEPRSILMSSADRVCPYRWATHLNYCEQYTRASAKYKCLSNKTEQSIYECLLGFCFNCFYFLRRHKFWLHRQFSSANSNEK